LNFHEQEGAYLKEKLMCFKETIRTKTVAHVETLLNLRKVTDLQLT